MSGREGSESAELFGELGSIASALGEVVLDDVEVDGEVAVEAAKEEGCELAKFIIIGELEETELKLRSVLRGFPPLLLLLLLLVLMVKGHVVGGEVMEGPSSDPIHLRLTLNFEFTVYKFGVGKAVCLVQGITSTKQVPLKACCHLRSQPAVMEEGSQQPGGQNFPQSVICVALDETQIKEKSREGGSRQRSV